MGKYSIFYFSFLAISLIGCRPTIHTRGNLLDDKMFATIIPGKTTLSQVKTALGPPSTKGMFFSNEWYYIGEQTETEAFFDPKIKERKIIHILFDDKGIVKTIEKVKTNGLLIKMNPEKTPTYGKDPSLLSELLGNIGRYEDPGSGRAKK